MPELKTDLNCAECFTFSTQ